MNTGEKRYKNRSVGAPLHEPAAALLQAAAATGSAPTTRLRSWRVCPPCMSVAYSKAM
jgi:hypothetical protein